MEKEKTMIPAHILTHALLYSAIVDGYLLLLMVLTSPRVWGYNDYPRAIKDQVPAQTPGEKRLAILLSIPWFVFVLGFPIYSTYALKGQTGGEIPFWAAALNVLVMTLLATLVDLLLLDWLIVCRITPRFVVIPGSDAADYKDFSHHFRGHARALPVQIILCLLVATIAWYF
jgi:hypothetical protein